MHSVLGDECELKDINTEEHVQSLFKRCLTKFRGNLSLFGALS